MTVQAVMTNISEGVSRAAAAAATAIVATAQWLGRTVSVIGQTVVQYAKNVVDFAAPYFASVKNFAVQNPALMFTAAGVAVGAVGYALVSNLFCQKEATETVVV